MKENLKSAETTLKTELSTGEGFDEVDEKVADINRGSEVSENFGQTAFLNGESYDELELDKSGAGKTKLDKEDSDKSVFDSLEIEKPKSEKAERDEEKDSSKKVVQSKEENSEFARKRREAERKEALSRARIEARNMAVLEMTGGINPYTKEKMRCGADIEKFFAMKAKFKENGDDQMREFLKDGVKNTHEVESLDDKVVDNEILKPDKVHNDDKKHNTLGNEEKHNVSKADDVGGQDLDGGSTIATRADLVEADASKTDKVQEGVPDEKIKKWYEDDSKNFRKSHPELSDEALKGLFESEQFLAFGEGKFGRVPLAHIYDGFLKMMEIFAGRAKSLAEKMYINKRSSPGALSSSEISKAKGWQDMSATEFEAVIQDAKRGKFRHS